MKADAASRCHLPKSLKLQSGCPGLGGLNARGGAQHAMQPWPPETQYAMVSSLGWPGLVPSHAKQMADAARNCSLLASRYAASSFRSNLLHVSGCASCVDLAHALLLVACPCLTTVRQACCLRSSPNLVLLRPRSSGPCLTTSMLRPPAATWLLILAAMGPTPLAARPWMPHKPLTMHTAQTTMWMLCLQWPAAGRQA